MTNSVQRNLTEVGNLGLTGFIEFVIFGAKLNAKIHCDFVSPPFTQLQWIMKILDPSELS